MPRPRKNSYGHDKPPYSYVALCAMAICSSPLKMRTLSEIYNYIMDNFPYYNNKDVRWQNSLRHNLSYNDCFVKVYRTTEVGERGSYWTLHQNSGQMFENGSLLRRKRRFNLEKKQKEKQSINKNIGNNNNNNANKERKCYLEKEYTDFTIENILKLN